MSKTLQLPLRAQLAIATPLSTKVSAARLCPYCGGAVKSWFRLDNQGERVMIWLCYGGEATRYVGCGWQEDAAELSQEYQAHQQEYQAHQQRCEACHAR